MWCVIYVMHHLTTMEQKQLLQDSDLVSDTFAPVLPFWVKVSGDLSENRAQLQSRVVGDDEWGLEKEFTQTDKSAIGPGIDSRRIEFRIVVEKVGIKGYWGIGNVSFPAR